MPIKHLVISGGGPVLIQILSAVQELERKEYLRMNDIETIYGTSAGAIIGVMLSLQFEWETLNDYILKRPWQDVFAITVHHILDAYAKKGIFDLDTIEKCFKPLFDAKDISLGITMDDFYRHTNKELHLFSFEINAYKVVDISHKTHPTLPLLRALQMSCALPILVSPVCLDDKCFMDGGVGCNYPLSFCIEAGNAPDDILGFKNKYSSEQSIVDASSTLLDYLLCFLFKAVFHVHNNCVQPIIKNEVVCDATTLSIDVLKSAVSNIDVRKDLFEKGRQSAHTFLQNRVQELG